MYKFIGLATYGTHDTDGSINTVHVCLVLTYIETTAQETLTSL